MLKWLKAGVPLKAKVIIAVLLLLITTGGGIMSYRFYDFTQNNPKFCVSCHLMQEAFDQWAESVHKGINCHDCHHLSVPEMNNLLVSFVLHRPDKVPDRHGKIIVPWRYCVGCHWEKKEEFASAPLINQSRMHAKHYFMEQIECSKCHGYILHEFTPEERFCMKCHQGKTVHGTGMEQLACLNCHTDRTPDLRPGRNKCLFCHGDETVRQKLMEEGSLDVTHYRPSQETIDRAIKINVPKDAPMQFNCYACHKPHQEVRPDWGNCLVCHRNIPQVGKHEMHINVLGMECKQCHKPHSWTVTEQSARKDCTTCHEYRKPSDFI
jgi:nitrate/TMAO reductase-like tetraheme cytochrome c subunit